MNEQSSPVPVAPWWTFGHVWLVLAGPALVVIAGFVTLYLAVRMPDPVVSEDYYRKGIKTNMAPEADAASLVPAVQARNHAVTGTTQVQGKP